jgi:hypothetical protein
MTTEGLPGWAREGLDLYLRFGIETGSGLRAILENDLLEAMGRCCQYGGSGAYDVWWIVSYLYNDAPGPAWGSPAKVKAWLERDWSAEREALRAERSSE